MTKYSVDYAEGYLEGMGFDVVDPEGKPVSFKKILKDAIDNVEYDCADKLLDCICTNEFLKIHPLN